MKLNHFVCPNCDHDSYESATETVCDACGVMFTVRESASCDLPAGPQRVPGRVVVIGRPSLPPPIESLDV